MGKKEPIFHKNIADFIPPFQVKTVDTVTADDSCNDDLVFGSTIDMSFAESIRLAATCAALAITKKEHLIPFPIVGRS
ncbi:PfkB family carbohydrate kinase [Bartonella sp. C271]|uniref:PfkB family carbohydrate kinase n=1 Tax=Bartonella sp. C271 TaxID=3070220 RepID=UPI0038B53BFC